ncbi:hypothetical protein K2173_012653 [Erythroxylum novogranatense]|uniref:Bet v I/Major latex protein domain-containing protein n=1 Tax=Erythroxylum novogranatense TaxID=1862640 RepID=A0AAV8TTE6_9ROSI|nr:hypothetical protein K2173_012653 [Erythroxylum novogranatense]
MALSGKLEAVIELKSPVDKIYNVFKCQSHHIPNHTPKNIQGFQIHEGDFETSGSVRIWNYTVEGKPGVFKERIELDDENKTVTFHGLEGDVMQIYKIYKPVWTFKPNGEGTTLAVCAIEYEKQNESVPAPNIYLDFIVSLTKDIDDGLSKA